MGAARAGSVLGRSIVAGTCGVAGLATSILGSSGRGSVRGTPDLGAAITMSSDVGGGGAGGGVPRSMATGVGAGAGAGAGVASGVEEATRAISLEVGGGGVASGLPSSTGASAGLMSTWLGSAAATTGAGSGLAGSALGGSDAAPIGGPRWGLAG